jgi:RHS repeat-associated protein
MKNELSELVPEDTVTDILYSFEPITHLIGDSNKYESGLFFYHGNHLSSTQLVTDIAGSISQAVLYAPFGQIISEYRSDWMMDTLPRYLFTSAERDQESNLYYMSARYYSSDGGTFISRDPLFEERHWMSTYNYCMNNPINRVDPTGMLCDGWDYDQNTNKLTWVSNKGGNTTQYVNSNGTTTPIPASTNSFIEGAENAGISVRFPKDAMPTFASTPQSTPSSIYQTQGLRSLEMWLNSPSESIGEAVGKTAANIGYGLVNSPFSLFTGRTIGGSSLNSIEKTDAFVDFAPLLLSGGLTKTGQVVKTANGLKGYNQFIKKSGTGFNGSNWQQRAGAAFQQNKIQQQGLSDFGTARKAQSVGTATNKEIRK